MIVATDREAHYVLDEILGNATDLPITEHATDTHGVTLVNFALFDLLRDAAVPADPRSREDHPVPGRHSAAAVQRPYPHAGPLLTRRLDTEPDRGALGTTCCAWPGSLKFGQATASLIVGKLSALDRQNTLAAALKEYGALRRTHLRRPLPVRPGLPAEDRPPAQQGRDPCTRCAATCSTPTRAPSGARHLQAPDRTGLVPDRCSPTR